MHNLGGKAVESKHKKEKMLSEVIEFLALIVPLSCKNFGNILVLTRGFDCRTC
jgi:hypothetical protein